MNGVKSSRRRRVAASSDAGASLRAVGTLSDVPTRTKRSWCRSRPWRRRLCGRTLAAFQGRLGENRRREQGRRGGGSATPISRAPKRTGTHHERPPRSRNPKRTACRAAVNYE